MNENSLIRDIGRSYIVSSMLPSAFFITLGAFLFRAFIPQLFLTPILPDQFFASLFLLFAACIMWTGFALYSMVNWTVRFYEGYYMPYRLKKIIIYLCFRVAHRNKTLRIRNVQRAIREQQPNWEKVIDDNYLQAWADYSDAELSGPLREADLLPTRLGNVLRASEQYPEKYGITAGINLWTRLVTMLPSELVNSLEEKNNNMLFLLNSSLLSYLLGVFSFVVWGICKLGNSCSTKLDVLSLMGIKEPLSSYSKGLAETDFLVLGCMLMIFGYFLYIFSIPVAKTIGLLIRSSFDLYRFDLLRQLNHSVPRTLSKEQRVWAKLSDFLVTGGSLGVMPLEFKYHLRSELVTENKESKSRRNQVAAKKKKP